MSMAFWTMNNLNTKADKAGWRRENVDNITDIVNSKTFSRKGKYTSVKNMLNKDSLLTQNFYDNTLKPFTKKLSTELYYAFDSAGWFCTQYKKGLLGEMDKGLNDVNVKKVSNIINGGDYGLENRKNYTKWIKEYFGVS
jgi:predicted chitinase